MNNNNEDKSKSFYSKEMTCDEISKIVSSHDQHSNVKLKIDGRITKDGRRQYRVAGKRWITITKEEFEQMGFVEKTGGDGMTLEKLAKIVIDLSTTVKDGFAKNDARWEKQEQFNAKQEQFNAKQEQFNAKQEQFNEKIEKKLDYHIKNGHKEIIKKLDYHIKNGHKEIIKKLDDHIKNGHKEIIKKLDDHIKSGH